MAKSEYSLPAEGFVRLQQIIGDKNENIPGVLPMSTTAWYAGVRDGKYPKPVKTGGIAMWSVKSIRQFISNLEMGTDDEGRQYSDLLPFPKHRSLEAYFLVAMLAGGKAAFNAYSDKEAFNALVNLAENTSWGRYMYFDIENAGTDAERASAYISDEDATILRKALGSKLLAFERDTNAHGVSWFNMRGFYDWSRG
jgi:prophage regulatory protein